MITRQDMWVVGSLLVVSAIGAYLGKGIKENHFPWYYNIISAIGSYAVWTAMVKYYKRPLMTGSMVYDVATTVFWFLVLVALGEKCTAVNIAGVFVAIIGMIMVAL